ncbi:putative Ig domain-containing protein [Rhodococcus spongiicola]|nr:putative Ig domain-containing protein [Rhodococcus spongiicola]
MMAITPDGTHAYVTMPDDRRVSVIAIDQAPTLIDTPPAGIEGQFYYHELTITGEPRPTIEVTAGALPDGLVLTADGFLTGVPNTAGRFEFTITASNGIGDDATLPVVLEITDTSSTGSLGSLGSLGSTEFAGSLGSSGS